MLIDPVSLAVGLVLSSIGFVGFVYGKRQQRLPHMVAGALLLIFPYFVPNVLVMSGIGLAIVALWIVVVKLGY